VTTSGGMLNLTARSQSSNGMPYTSGLIDTGGDFATGGNNLPGFSFKYGYVEARMKLTTGSGLWPAFWMMPTPTADGTYHDGDGEIDIMEQVGTDPTRTEAHLHHNGTQGKSYDTGLDLSAGFHTYGLDWEPDHMTWYFDGKAFYTVTSNVPNVAEYIIFNLAVGDANSWPGAPNGNTQIPSTMQVDYVRAFQLPGQTASGPGAITGAASAADILAGAASPASSPSANDPSASSLVLQTDDAIQFTPVADDAGTQSAPVFDYPGWRQHDRNHEWDDSTSNDINSGADLIELVS
jgi:beta-glucanase (GH16 family)